MDLNPLSDKDIKGLANDLEAERNMLEMNEGDQAKVIFQRYAPVAATQICRLASNGSSERLRFQAATYVLDRAIGRVGEQPIGAADPLVLLMEEISRTVPPDEAAQLRAQVRGLVDDNKSGTELGEGASDA